jgi:hypothetical protein
MGVEPVKEWDNFGDNDSIDSMFGGGPVMQYDEQQVQPLESETGPEYQEDNYPVKKVKRGRKPKEEDPLTEYRSAKYSASQIEKLNLIKEAMSTTNDGEALRWALDAAYKANRKKIERIVEEKLRIESL